MAFRLWNQRAAGLVGRRTAAGIRGVCGNDYGIFVAPRQGGTLFKIPVAGKESATPGGVFIDATVKMMKPIVAMKQGTFAYLGLKNGTW